MSDREHKTNEYIWQQVNVLAGRQEILSSTFGCRSQAVMVRPCLLAGGNAQQMSNTPHAIGH